MRQEGQKENEIYLHDFDILIKNVVINKKSFSSQSIIFLSIYFPLILKVLSCISAYPQWRSAGAAEPGAGLGGAKMVFLGAPNWKKSNKSRKKRKGLLKKMSTGQK